MFRPLAFALVLVVACSSSGGPDAAAVSDVATDPTDDLADSPRDDLSQDTSDDAQADAPDDLDGSEAFDTDASASDEGDLGAGDADDASDSTDAAEVDDASDVMDASDASDVMDASDASDATDASDASDATDADVAEADAQWPCPREWVRHEAGGCGPAVLLCASFGGAAPDACEGVDYAHPHGVADVDGGTSRGFYLTADGAIGGGWSEHPWACPAGWSAQPDGTCSAALPSDCPSGSVALPGARCTATAMRDCPSGEYADVSAEVGSARQVRVRAGAPSAGADGSVTHPFPTITQAIDAAGRGGWVLVAAGTYPETFAPTAGVHIVGRCAAMVRVAPTDPFPVAEVTGGSLDLRGCTLSGPRIGVYASAGAHVTLRGVIVDGCSIEGVFATGTNTTLEARDVVITGTRASPGRDQGIGVRVDQEASVTLSNVAITNNQQSAVWVDGAASHAELSDVLLRATVPVSTDVPMLGGLMGYGLHVTDGATAHAVRTVVADNHHLGVVAEGRNARIDAEDLIVQGTIAAPELLLTGAVGAVSAGSVTLSRALIERNAERGLFARDNGAITASDAWVRGVTASDDGESGYTIAVLNRGRVVGQRLTLEQGQVWGVSGGDPRAGLSVAGVIELNDSVVRDTRRIDTGLFGGGVAAYLGTTVILRRTLVENLFEAGIGSATPGSNVNLEDVIVRDVTPTPRGFGVGGVATAAAQLHLNRAAFVGVHGVGVATARQATSISVGGAVLDGQDLYVRGVGLAQIDFDLARPAFGAGPSVAFGINVGAGTRIALTRATFIGGAVGSAGFGVLGALSLRDALFVDFDQLGVRNDTVTSSVELNNVSSVRIGRTGVSVDSALPEVRLPTTRD